MAASSIHCIFKGSPGHLDQDAKNTFELPRVSFAKVLKIRGCYEEGRQLISLHFYRGAVATSSGGKTRPKKSF